MIKALDALSGVTQAESGHLAVRRRGEALDRPQPPGVWRVAFGRPPAGWLATGEARDFIGPFVMEKRHPLLLGVTLAGGSPGGIASVNEEIPGGASISRVTMVVPPAETSSRRRAGDAESLASVNEIAARPSVADSDRSAAVMPTLASGSPTDTHSTPSSSGLPRSAAVRSLRTISRPVRPASSRARRTPSASG